VVGLSFSCDRLEAYSPEVLMLWAYRYALPERGSHLFTVAAGPFGEVLVKVPEGLVLFLSAHVPDTSATLTSRKSKS
jgi:hypothetical protein